MPRRRCCRGEVLVAARRNLISRLMSSLIAHLPPRRLFIDADRDRHGSSRTVPFHPPPNLASSCLLASPYDSFYSSLFAILCHPNREDMHRSARFIRGSVKNRNANASVVFLSCHCTTWPYIFRQRTSTPLHPRAVRVSISSHEWSMRRSETMVSSIVTVVDTVVVTRWFKSLTRDSCCQPQHNAVPTSTRTAPCSLFPLLFLIDSFRFFPLLMFMNYDSFETYPLTQESRTRAPLCVIIYTSILVYVPTVEILIVPKILPPTMFRTNASHRTSIAENPVPTPSIHWFSFEFMLSR